MWSVDGRPNGSFDVSSCSVPKRPHWCGIGSNGGKSLVSWTPYWALPVDRLVLPVHRSLWKGKVTFHSDAWAGAIKRNRNGQMVHRPILIRQTGVSSPQKCGHQREGSQTPAPPHARSYLPPTRPGEHVHRSPRCTSLRCPTNLPLSTTVRETKIRGSTFPPPHHPLLRRNAVYFCTGVYT